MTDNVRTCIDALNDAIDSVTESALEKLATIENRVAVLKESIKVKNDVIKASNEALMKMIYEASQEADSMHARLDQVENELAPPKETEDANARQSRVVASLGDSLAAL